MRQKRTTPQWLTPALVGLFLVLNTNLFAQVTNLVAFTTFEIDPSGQPGWPWAYAYQWGYDPNPNVAPTYDTWYMYPDSDPTNTCERVNFDMTAWAPMPTGAGFGMGFGAVMNMSSFDPAVVAMSTNRADYIMSFDAKVEGLLPGVTTIGVQMQVQMEAPDDTVQPPDADFDADRIIQINKDLQLGSNWTHFEYTLDDAAVDDKTPEKNLVLYGNLINSANYNLNIHQPYDQFGLDADNYVYIDNIMLQVINYTNSSPLPPIAGLTIADWNMDDKDITYSWVGGGWVQESNALPTFSGSAHAYGYGVGGSNAWILQMDNSIYTTTNVPSFAGGNTGGGGPVNYSLFNTPDLSAYRVSFDARVEGLAPDKLNTTCRLQLFLNVPDDTLQPPDANTDLDLLVRLDFPIPVETNWQTFSYTLNKGSAGLGSKANFTAFFNLINDLSMQWQIENAQSAADWGFDSDNILVIDNIKLERLYVGCPPLTVTPSGSNVTVTWAAPSNGTAKLQSATNATGPFTDVAGATSPYTTSLAGGPKFFRTQWVPPTP